MGAVSAPVDIARLGRLIDRIGTLVEEAQQSVGPRPAWSAKLGDRLEWDGKDRKASAAIIRLLVEEEGATFAGSAGGDSTLTIAGVRTSCTAGAWGLLRNWQTAAWRNINAAGGLTAETCPRHVESEAKPGHCGRCGTPLDPFNPYGSGPMPVELRKD
jgi:hypothetical protein